MARQICALFFDKKCVENDRVYTRFLVEKFVYRANVRCPNHVVEVFELATLFFKLIVLM